MQWTHPTGLNFLYDIKQFIGTGCVSLRILAMAEYLFQNVRRKCSGMYHAQLLQPTCSALGELGITEGTK